MQCRWANDQDGKTNLWYWTHTDSTLEIPTMDTATALTFLLAREHLDPLLPRSVLSVIAPYFDRAEVVLAETRFEQWRHKMCLIDPGPALKPPEIPDDVRRTVYEALESGRCIQCNYRSRESGQAQEFKIHPLGLVVRHGIYYLVGTVWNYDDPRHLALHRMSSALLLDEATRTPDGFNLESYIHAEQSFAYPYSSATLRLKARFSTAAAFHLRECRLSDDQALVELNDGWVRVSATVPDTAELRWWFLGFGDQVEVLGPKGLRSEFIATTQGLAGTDLGWIRLHHFRDLLRK